MNTIFKKVSCVLFEKDVFGKNKYIIGTVQRLALVSSLNPNMSLNDENRKVVRGGSWKDVAYFIQTSTRTFEYQDTAKCYIGFRCAVDFLGRDKKDFE